MRFISEFSYPDISQRRVILFNLFITFITLGYIYFDLSYMMKYYSVYLSICKIVFMSALAGIVCGNILGKIVFNRFEKSRFVYIASDLLFILICLVYIFFRVRDAAEPYSLLDLLLQSSYYILSLSFMITFMAGVKINYFLKVTCGDFIDDKRAVIPFFIH